MTNVSTTEGDICMIEFQRPLSKRFEASEVPGNTFSQHCIAWHATIAIGAGSGNGPETTDATVTTPWTWPRSFVFSFPAHETIVIDNGRRFAPAPLLPNTFRRLIALALEFPHCRVKSSGGKKLSMKIPCTSHCKTLRIRQVVKTKLGPK